jgi:hypothetical protein
LHTPVIDPRDSMGAENTALSGASVSVNAKTDQSSKHLMAPTMNQSSRPTARLLIGPERIWTIGQLKTF